MGDYRLRINESERQLFGHALMAALEMADDDFTRAGIMALYSRIMGPITSGPKIRLNLNWRLREVFEETPRLTGAVDHPQLPDVIPTLPLVDQFIESCKGRDLRPKTITWYRQWLDPFAVAHPDLPLEPAIIEGYLGTISAGHETKAAVYRSLKVFYRHIWPRLGMGAMVNPIALIKGPKPSRKVPLSFSEDQLLKVRDACDTPLKEAIIFTFLDTGLRLDEVHNLKWLDIKHEGEDYLAKVTGKTGEREVPISREVVAMLKKIQWEDCLWVGPRGPIGYWRMEKIVKEVLAAAGFVGKRIGPHTLRHTFGRRFIAGGGDSLVLKDIFGHTTTTMVDRYVHLDRSETAKQHHLVSPIRGMLKKEGE